MRTSQTTTKQRDTSERSRGWLLTIVHTPVDMRVPRSLRLANPVIPIDRANVRGANAIIIADAAISNGKVTLHRVGDSYEIEDTGSTNPVRINGDTIRRIPLRDNDVARIGDTVFVVEVDDVARGVRRAGGFQDAEVDALMSDLCMYDATASCQFRIDACLFEPDVRAVALWSPGPKATRLAGDWLASRWDTLAHFVPADAPDAAERVAQTPEGHAVIVQRLELAPPPRQRALVDALETHSEGGRRPFAFSVSHDRRGTDISSVRQLLAFTRSSELTIPPVRARKTDLLAALTQLVSERGGPVELQFSPSLIERILCHDWYYDLAELDMVAERVHAAIQRGSEVTQAILPNDFRHPDAEPDFTATKAINDRTVREALIEYQGNMKAVAKHFGLSRTYFYRRLKQEAVDIDRAREAWKKHRDRGGTYEDE